MDTIQKNDVVILPNKEEKSGKVKENVVITSSGLAATKSAEISTQEAAKKFYKPKEYDRKLIDDGTAKRNIKVKAFKEGKSVKDPYTEKKLTLYRRIK